MDRFIRCKGGSYINRERIISVFDKIDSEGEQRFYISVDFVTCIGKIQISEQQFQELINTQM